MSRRISRLIQPLPRAFRTLFESFRFWCPVHKDGRYVLIDDYFHVHGQRVYKYIYSCLELYARMMVVFGTIGITLVLLNFKLDTNSHLPKGTPLQRVTIEYGSFSKSQFVRQTEPHDSELW